MTHLVSTNAVLQPPRVRPPRAIPLRDQLARDPIATLIRLHLTYFLRHRRRLSLDQPKRFTELIQRRKLVDRDPRFPSLIDKLSVKQVVANMLGPDWITPTLWSGDVLPDEPPFPLPFVVKSRHGCKHVRVVCREGEDWRAVRQATEAWMRAPYGRWLDEWGYRDVPRGLMIEPFVGKAPELPIDYKLYVFHGRVEAIQVHLNRGGKHRWKLYDRGWKRMSAGDDLTAVTPPSSLARMIAGAETLGSTFDFVRIDFYDVDGAPRFGEMTFYPGSGLDPFDPPSLDDRLGQCWLAGSDAEDALVSPYGIQRRRLLI